MGKAPHHSEAQLRHLQNGCHNTVDVLIINLSKCSGSARIRCLGSGSCYPVVLRTVGDFNTVFKSRFYYYSAMVRPTGQKTAAIENIVCY